METITKEMGRKILKRVKDTAKQAGSVENVNTCNGWGFGGHIGKVYTVQVGETIFTFRDLKWSTRHHGTLLSRSYLINGERVTATHFYIKLHELWDI